MSDTESSEASEGGAEITLYECRRCPGQRFTAPERDNHRLQHRREREQERERSRGKGKGRASSPSRSEVTLFDEIVVRETANGEEIVVTPSPRQKASPSKRKTPASKPGPASKKNKKEGKKSRRKRESVKRYDASQTTTAKYPGA